MVKGHCMKCKEKRDMVDAKMTQTPKGGFMAKGACKSCGTKMCAMMSKDNAEAAVKMGEAKKAY